MKDKFHFLTLKEAVAVQIFYSSPDDENLTGKTLNSDSWVEATGVVTGITFRENGITEDELLQKLIAEKAYKKIVETYDRPDATFKIVVTYKNDKGENKETDLTNAIEMALSPEELPKQVMDFLLEKEEFSFLKN
ncbi:MAG TPA: hypothetical protein VN922_14235 [Bacteroidia bacterium]|nr:hypothetical protein [Bacteroidia bacterium]